ncbi:universal stress protein [Fulvivirga sediminis]|uniref:Universal stress protein n=1 Tax=Fulvivirga sediminis TaxID=2803949 RepID=A0A937F6H7_9BACT|nr:universal stress protein [Fulvivirga sediminis]MBL3655921.1 universal stress protein [Fulvivirga sediminis]
MKSKFNTILVPVNFSDYAAHAMDLAIEIAQKRSSKILLLHVINVPDYRGVVEGVKVNFLDSVRYVTSQHLDGLVDKAKDHGIEASYTVVAGLPGAEIVKFAREKQVSLIVLGSKDYKHMDEMLGGSATERIVRYTDCPVITAKAPIHLASVKNVVFATDLKTTHTFITSELKSLIALTGANLHILKVNTRETWMPDVQIEKQLKAFNDIHGFENFTFKVCNSETIEDGIVHYYENIGAEAVAMSIHSLYHHNSRSSNYFITEKVLQSGPGLLWTCANESSRSWGS